MRLATFNQDLNMSTTRVPVIFIHGLWLHASSWAPWRDYFEAAGYSTRAPGWPDEADTVAAARANPHAVANHSIDDIVAHYERIVSTLDTIPILVGHSFGGLIVEKMLGQGIGRAAIAIDPAQIKGVLPLPLAQLRSALPALANPLNLTRAVSLTKSEFRYGFGNALTEHESDDLYDKWNIPSPAKPLFQAAAANFVLHSQAKVDTANDTRGPLLLISGSADHTVPDVSTRATFKQYRHSLALTQFKQFEGRGHSLVIDSGWRDVARECLAWLRQSDLAAVRGLDD
jgi:pimeloyl-ACP methyl ester carboxylesterase